MQLDMPWLDDIHGTPALFRRETEEEWMESEERTGETAELQSGWRNRQRETETETGRDR